MQLTCIHGEFDICNECFEEPVKHLPRCPDCNSRIPVGLVCPRCKHSFVGEAIGYMLDKNKRDPASKQ